MTYFHWEDGFDRNFLLSKINSFRTVKTGRCSFEAAKYAFWVPVLNSAIRAEKSVNTLKSRCISKAISDHLLVLNNPDQFLQRCSRAFEEIAGGGMKKFIVFFNFTYVGPKLINWIADGSSRIYWQPKHDSGVYMRACEARNSLQRVLSAKGVSNHSEGLTDVLVHVQAHDFMHAWEQASDTVDRLRGVLNLVVNYDRPINPFRGLSKPHAVNKFRLGPFRTVHNPDGALAAEVFWYEPRWSHEHGSAKFAGTPESVRLHIVRRWKQATSNPLSDCIADGLLRYFRALDQHDPDATLVGLWGALEALTGTQKEKYDVTVSRIVRLFKEQIDVRQIALHVKLRRNSMIHAAKSPESDEVEAVILHAERLVSQILRFCINRGKRFRSQRELTTFLDLPLNLEALKRHQGIIADFVDYQKR